MNVQDRIKKAHIAIMQHKTFCSYSGILACGKVKVNDDVSTAATNGWDVYYNPDFIEQYMKPDPELRFLILHEAQHKATTRTHNWPTSQQITSSTCHWLTWMRVRGSSRCLALVFSLTLSIVGGQSSRSSKTSRLMVRGKVKAMVMAWMSMTGRTQ